MDEPTGRAAGYLTVRSWMWRQQFKQTNSARISTDHRTGDWHIWLTKPFQRRNGHHQLSQNSLGKDALRCDLAKVLFQTCRLVLSVKEREAVHGETRLLELMSYGLTALAAIVVTAFCFAYGVELSPALEKPAVDPRVSKDCSSEELVCGIGNNGRLARFHV